MTAKRNDPGMGPSMPTPTTTSWQDGNLQDQFIRHKGKKIAFNAGRHRMTGTIVSVDSQMHRVYVDVESGLEPGIHSFIISRMSGFALLRDR